MKMNSGNLPAKGVESRRSMNRVTTRRPKAPAITIKAIALSATTAMPPADMVPLTTSVLIESASRLSTSSITAAPMIAFAASVWSLPSSFNTLAVIAMLVAVSAVPIKIAVGVSYPKSSESQYPADPRNDYPDPGNYPVPG